MNHLGIALRGILLLAGLALLGGCQPSNVETPVVDPKRQVVIALDQKGCPVAAVPTVPSCADKAFKKPVARDAICADQRDTISWRIDSPAKGATFRILFDKKDAQYPTDCGRASQWQPAGTTVHCTVVQDKTAEYYYKIELQTDQFECGLDPTIYVNRH